MRRSIAYPTMSPSSDRLPSTALPTMPAARRGHVTLVAHLLQPSQATWVQGMSELKTHRDQSLGDCELWH